MVRNFFEKAITVTHQLESQRRILRKIDIVLHHHRDVQVLMISSYGLRGLFFVTITIGKRLLFDSGSKRSKLNLGSRKLVFKSITERKINCVNDVKWLKRFICSLLHFYLKDGDDNLYFIFLVLKVSVCLNVSLGHNRWTKQQSMDEALRPHSKYLSQKLNVLLNTGLLKY